jgi:hypothetical protein
LRHSTRTVLCWVFFKIGSVELFPRGWLQISILLISAS